MAKFNLEISSWLSGIFRRTEVSRNIPKLREPEITVQRSFFTVPTSVQLWSSAINGSGRAIARPEISNEASHPKLSFICNLWGTFFFSRIKESDAENSAEIALAAVSPRACSFNPKASNRESRALIIKLIPEISTGVFVSFRA